MVIRGVAAAMLVLSVVVWLWSPPWDVLLAIPIGAAVGLAIGVAVARGVERRRWRDGVPPSEITWRDKTPPVREGTYPREPDSGF